MCQASARDIKDFLSQWSPCLLAEPRTSCCHTCHCTEAQTTEHKSLHLHLPTATSGPSNGRKPCCGPVGPSARYPGLCPILSHREQATCWPQAGQVAATGQRAPNRKDKGLEEHSYFFLPASRREHGSLQILRTPQNGVAVALASLLSG